MNKISIGFGLILLLVLAMAAPLYAAAPQVKVAVLPFDLQAQTPDEGLTRSIPQMLQERLEKEGASITFASDITDYSDWNYDKFRAEGIRMGVDWIITGHLFKSGQSVSIDAQMISIYENQPPLTFFSQAPDMESLYAAVNNLGRDITGTLFQKQVIAAIRIVGNKRVEQDAILRVITAKPGEILKPDTLSKDMGLIYKMGYFDNVVVSKNALDRGVEVVFEVTEKPSVRTIKFEGNHIYDDEELFDVVSTTTGSILNLFKINNDVERIRQLYFEKNYHNCKITYKVEPLKNDQADILITLDEGDKVRIEEIAFQGNKYFSDKKIKKVMKTQEKGFWSFITESGNLNETELDNDVLRIESLYKNNGFINVKVSDAHVEVGEKSITVSFRIEEGDQYKTGTVDIQGDILTTKEDLLERLVSQESELYNRELIRRDMITLNDLYANEGYANVQVIPQVHQNNETKTVNLTFTINKKDLVYFDRILITGNGKTRDKVIRREMAITEQGRYSMKGIQRSNRNLVVKDYFSNIEINPVKTEDPNKRDVEVKVTEKPTGNFAFGGGFSTDDGPFGEFSIEERNLFGRGQNLKFTARISGTTGLFDIGFTEPWLFDKPISAGFDLYKFDYEYDYYDKKSYGLTLKSAYRKIWDYTAIGVNYNIEDFEISNVETDYTSVSEGSYLTSSIEPYITYDSRNHYFLPTRGMYHRLGVEYAGEFVGGEIDFTRYTLESAIFFPLFWKFSAGLHAKGGYLDDRTNGDPDIDWERFYLGGINSIRGVDKYDINTTPEGSAIQRGGEKMVQFNAEMLFPIQEDTGVYGVFFYDRGDVYRNSEDVDLADMYSTVGFELRWNSPMGPIRLAYGFVLEGKDTHDTGDGQFDFSIGAFF